MIQINSFTFNFRKYIKRVMKIAVLIFFIYLINSLLNYLYFKEDLWSKILWHNYYCEEQNIDNLLLGSSHIYNNINPFLLDELSGENNFNLSTPGQRLDSSYYLLKEADKEHNISHVYLDVYCWRATGEIGDFKHKDLFCSWFNTDYMKMSINKLEYIFSISEPVNYVHSLFPFTRYRYQVFDTAHIREQLEDKREPEYYYKNIDEQGNITEYQDKGYYYTDVEMDSRYLLRELNPLDQEPMTKDAEQYLRRIIEYCKENEIELTIFSAPFYELHVMEMQSYDNYVEQVRKIAAEYGLSYYDFNLCKEEYLPIQKNQYFMNVGHLNSRGAELFTTFLYDVVEGNVNVEDCFWKSYEEKLANSEPAIYGLLYEEGEAERRFVVASNRVEGLEYKLTLIETDENGKISEDMLQDYSENKEFVLEKGRNGICRIEARNRGEAENFQVLEVEY